MCLPRFGTANSQADHLLTTSTYSDLNQLVSQAGGGYLHVRGHLDEPGTVMVDGQPARLLPGSVFESTTSAATGANTSEVVATDLNGNSTMQGYEVSIGGSAPTYGYDANGNLSRKVEGGVTWTYVWGTENRLKCSGWHSLRRMAELVASLVPARRLALAEEDAAMSRQPGQGGRLPSARASAAFP